MTKRQFVVLAFRLYAVYSAIVLIESLPAEVSWAFMPFPDGRGSEIIWLILKTAVPIWVIYVLWSRGEWLMQKIFDIRTLANIDEQEKHIKSIEAESKSKHSNSLEEPITPETIERTVISLIGVFLLATQLPFLIYKVINLANSDHRHNVVTPAEILQAVIVPLGEILIALFLALRPWKLQFWLWKLQSAEGNNHPDDKVL